MPDANDALLETVLREKRLYHVCQPLYELKAWRLFGYEVLLRSDLFDGPEPLFRTAMQADRLFELDTFSMFHAISAYDDYRRSKHAKWFVNVFPSTLVHPDFLPFLESIRGFAFPNKNVVIEVNEAERIADMPELKNVISYVKTQLGFAVALDDVGNGHASLQAIVELEPDIVKLDRYFSSHLFGSKPKQSMVQMLARFCQDSGIRLVLEGIEDPKDLATAKALGVHLGQGFLLGAPAPIGNVFYKGE